MTWPVSNRSESLDVDVHYLRRQVGSYLGYSHNPATWNDEKFQIVSECIDSGLRTYYFPPSLPTDRVHGKERSHSWSFLRPVRDLVTSADISTYALSPDFDYLIGEIAIADSSGNSYGVLKNTTDTRIRVMLNTTDSTGPPAMAVTRPVVNPGAGPQAQELVLYPTPDAAYTLTFQYQSHPQKLTDENPYPLGGRGHSNGILAAVMAAAEMRATGDEGPWHRSFLNQVTSNISRDWQRGPGSLGYNGDASCSGVTRGDLRRANSLYYGSISLDGTEYTG